MAPRRRFLEGAVIGDSGDVRTWELTGVDSIAGLGTITARLRREDDETAAVITCSPIGDPTDRLISVPLGGWLATLGQDPEVDDAGNYHVDVANTGGITFPNGLSAVLPVRYPR